MTTPESPASLEGNKSVLGPILWLETLRLVIAPRIAALVFKAGGEIETRSDLHKRFCEEHELRISYSTFSSWCEDLGISFKKRIEVNIPGWKSMPKPTTDSASTPHQQEVIRDPEIESLEPVVWDEPVVLPPNVFTDGMPDILPGGMRAPSFFSNDFGN
jgi:hypothetical protein